MIPVTKEELATKRWPDAQLVVYAEQQPEYTPLPVVRFPDGTVFSEWQPSADEAALLAKGGTLRIRLWQFTFHQPLQPVRVELV